MMENGGVASNSFVVQVSNTDVPTIDIIDASDSGVSSIDNITSDTTPTVEGTAEVGATVVITDENGNEVGRAVIGDDGTYSITTTELSEGSQTLMITATDPEGNTSYSTQEITIDTDVNAPSITMESTGTDGVYNADELGTDGTVTATVGLPSDAAAGDTLTINGNSTTLTDAQITAGEVTTEVAPGSTVTATITDSAGNTSDQATTTVASSDTDVNAPSITMESTGTDGVYNADELGTDGTVTANSWITF